MSDVSPHALAGTHKAAFGPQAGWGAGDFAEYLTDPKTLVIGTEKCFVLVRLAGPEAEILTLATHPDIQRQGRATAVLRDALRHLKAVNVEEVFLDVSDQNTAARALYARCGFTGFALRNNYYKNGTTAICMKAVLSPASPA
ncbi:GNAT family N-acetyltransferase [Octadecabacter sp. G9-8]|uniref:GNAT family N-acetyltransferase n=1 Tax=Octadecabacter dasysiphoniae TaxID=2909341 RepID=A0ABS9CQV8_9RHOB|nr:N-acetyltransferase [Octadecabacter dasysiphoniae]MCF2869620.1 GNAT family N-acetyltransferase [Octadecabacter dasysiphoniae]